MRYPKPEHHVALEPVHFHANPEYHQRVARYGGLYVVGGDGQPGVPAWPCGKVLAFGSGTFSRDVFADGVVTGLNGVGSVFYAALQVAYTLGYREVFALGLDLSGPHFDGTPASPHVERQNELFRFIPEDMSVLTCGSPESRAIFEKVEFGAVCE
jgi:hypothetical protein